MGGRVEGDLSVDAELAQLGVEIAEGALGVIGAAALVYADEDIAGAQGLDQVHHPVVPAGPQDALVVPV